MAYTSDKTRLDAANDDRRVLSDEAQEEVRQYRKDHPEATYGMIADMFSIGRTTAYYTCNPDKYEDVISKNRKRNRENARDDYDKEVAVERVLRTRTKKHKLHSELAFKSKIKKEES